MTGISRGAFPQGPARHVIQSPNDRPRQRRCPLPGHTSPDAAARCDPGAHSVGCPMSCLLPLDGALPWRSLTVATAGAGSIGVPTSLTVGQMWRSLPPTGGDVHTAGGADQLVAGPPLRITSRCPRRVATRQGSSPCPSSERCRVTPTRAGREAVLSEQPEERPSLPRRRRMPTTGRHERESSDRSRSVSSIPTTPGQDETPASCPVSVPAAAIARDQVDQFRVVEVLQSDSQECFAERRLVDRGTVGEIVLATPQRPGLLHLS